MKNHSKTQKNKTKQKSETLGAIIGADIVPKVSEIFVFLFVFEWFFIFFSMTLIFYFFVFDWFFRFWYLGEFLHVTFPEMWHSHIPSWEKSFELLPQEGM